MLYPPGAVERAMKAHEVIMRALDGQLTWIQAAEILGRSPRSIRRLRWRLEQYGYDGLFDRRRRTPSPKRAPVAEVQRLLALYRHRYQGFNVRHFHALARRQHGVRFCYAFVKKALQSAGLVPKHRPRGRHRRRREPRPCFGELLHLDGSRHRWLALVPDQGLTLIAVVDDATKRLLYAELRDGGESVGAIMTALHAVLTRYGLPMALYTDRAHWAVHTPVAGGAPDRRRLTQVGRALARLGIEHILGYSPAARGRSERVNRTLQDRLVNELRLAGITTVPAANRYLRERFLPAFNDEFGRPPADPAPIAWISSWPNSRAAAPAPASASSSAGISPATTRSGTAPAASGATTARAAPGAPPSPPMPFTERSVHAVKQLRSDHVSATYPPGRKSAWCWPSHSR